MKNITNLVLIISLIVSDGVMSQVSDFRLASSDEPKSFTLSKAMRRALDSNYALKQIREQVRVALGQSLGAASKILPSASFKASAQALSPSGAGSYKAGLSMLLPLFDAKSFLNARGARANVLAAKLKLQHESDVLMLRVGENYVAALIAKSVHDVAKLEFAQYQKQLEVLSKKASLGLVRKLDVFRAEYLLHKSRSDLSQKEWEFQKALAKLGNVINETQYFNIEPFSVDSAYLSKSRAELLDLAANTAQVKSLRKKVLVSKYQLNGETLGFLPKLNASIDSGWDFGFGGSSIAKRGQHSTLAMLNFELPIFLGGSRWASLKTQRAKRNIDTLSLKQQEQSNSLNIDGLLELITTLKKANASSKIALDSALKAKDSADRLFARGEATGLEVAEANLNLISARNELSAASHKTELGKIKLLFAVGKISQMLE